MTFLSFSFGILFDLLVFLACFFFFCLKEREKTRSWVAEWGVFGIMERREIQIGVFCEIFFIKEMIKIMLICNKDFVT